MVVDLIPANKAMVKYHFPIPYCIRWDLTLSILKFSALWMLLREIGNFLSPVIWTFRVSLLQRESSRRIGYCTAIAMEDFQKSRTPERKLYLRQKCVGLRFENTSDLRGRFQIR